jgi:hypothetical protein
MDCSTCRSLFSASFDGRLAGERRQEFQLHVQACASCDSEFALYRRVFSTIRALPDGAAPPFKVPNEVPGSLAASNRFSGRPRFARAAAGFLLMIGLVGTHVLVFQWSRERASVEQRGGNATVQSPTIAPPVLAAANLPGALRDHLEATDLFIRTAGQVPDEAGADGVAFLKADFEGSELQKRSAELRQQIASLPPEQRGPVIQYLDAADEFAGPMQGLLRQPKVSIAAIRGVASRSRVARELDGFRPRVASLPRGQSFAKVCQVSPGGLKPDACLILESKRARLSGTFDGAIAGLEKFPKKYADSPLRNTAEYLLLDTYLACDRYSELIERIPRMRSMRPSGIPSDSLSRFIVVLRTERGETIIHGSSSPIMQRATFDWSSPQFACPPTFLPMKSEVLRPMTEDVAPAPEAPKK